MATVDKLVVKIEADLADLKRKLGQATSETKNATKRMERSFGDVRKKIGGVGSAIFSLKGALIGLGVGAGIKSLIDVGTSVESLQIRFETLFGSVEEGGKAFDTMANFASKVPFSLQEIQAGAGSLLAVAKDADELGELLEMTGTIAAATGLDFATTSQQIQRSLSAGINSADLFRERGVTALLGFAGGVQTSVEDSRAALEKFAKDNDGITDRLAGTFQGTLSMIGDAIFSFQRTVNDAGFFSSLTQHFQNLKNTIDNNQEEIKEFAKNLSSVLVGAMQGFVTAIKAVVDNAELLKNVFITFVAIKLGAVIGTIISAFVGLKVALAGTTAAQVAFNTATKMNPYVAAASVIAAGIALVVTNFSKLTQALGINTQELEENTKQLSAQEQELQEIAEIQKKVNELRRQGIIKAEGVEDFGGINEAIKKAKERETAVNKADKAIKELIETEKDNQAKLSMTTFELAKYNLEKEHNLKFSSEQLAILEKEIAKTKELNEAKKLQTEIEKEQAEVTKMIDEIEQVEKMKPVLDQLKQLKEIEELENEIAEANNKTRTDSIRILEELGIRNKDYRAEIDALNQAHALGQISTDEYQHAITRLNMKMFEATEAGGILMNGLNRTMDSLSTTMADSLMHMGEGWKGFRDSLKGIVRDIIAQFMRVQMQAMVTRAIAGMGGGGGIFSSIGSLFGGGGVPTGTSNYASYGGGGFFRQGGGYVAPNRPYMVGERGPEMFVPNTAGNIMTNNQSRQMAGAGATVNQTLNFDVGVAQTVRAEIVSLLPTIKQQSVDAMIDAKERGGKVADIFK